MQAEATAITRYEILPPGAWVSSYVPVAPVVPATQDEPDTVPTHAVCVHGPDGAGADWIIVPALPGDGVQESDTVRVDCAIAQMEISRNSNSFIRFLFPVNMAGMCTSTRRR